MRIAVIFLFITGLMAQEVDMPTTRIEFILPGDDGVELLQYSCAINGDLSSLKVGYAKLETLYFASADVAHIVQNVWGDALVKMEKMESGRQCRIVFGEKSVVFTKDGNLLLGENAESQVQANVYGVPGVDQCNLRWYLVTKQSGAKSGEVRVRRP